MDNNNFQDVTVPDAKVAGTGVNPTASIGYGEVASATPASISAPLTAQQLQAPAPGVVSSAPLPPVPPQAPRSHFSFKKYRKFVFIAILVLLIVGGIAAVTNNVAQRKGNNASLANADRFTTQQISLENLNSGESSTLLGTRSLVINGPLLAHDSFTISPSGQPSNANRGQIYYDKDNNQLAYFNGTQFVTLTGGVESVGGLSGNVIVGQGLSATNGQINNTGVLSLQGQTGNVTLVAGPGIAINGTTISTTGGGGVTSIGGKSGAINLGSGLSIDSSNNLKNSGIIGAAAGTGISIVNDGAGNITISTSGEPGTGTVTSPGGTVGRLAKFTGAQDISDSLISESGTTITVNGDLSVTGALTLGTALSVGNGGTGTTALAANGVVLGNGAGALTAVTAASPGLCFISNAGAPTFQACPGGVTSLNGLSGVLTIANAAGAGSTITINNASTAQKGIAQFNSTNFTDNGAGTINTVQNINSAATPTFSGVNTNSINPSGALTVGASGQAFTLQGTSGSVINATSGVNTTTVAFQAPTANVTYRFATAAAGTYDICTMVGNCAGIGGGVTTAGGTAGTLPVFTGAQAIGDSLVSQSGGTVTVAGNLNLTSGNVYQINGTQISSANLSNDSNLAKLNATQTFTGTTNIFQNASNSALAFSIQNASSQRVFSVNTTTGAAVFGQGSALGAQLVLSNATNANTITLVPAVASLNRTITFPDDTGTVCLSTGNCAGAGVTLQSAYNNSSNPEITVDATRGALTVRDNATPIGANLLEVQNNGGGTTYFAVTSGGTSTTGTSTSSGNINTTGGALQTNSTTRVDNTGNLTNIGNITGTGAITIASSGAGNDVTIDGADQFIVQDASVFNGQTTFNTDVDLTLADTENLNITNTVTGTNAVNLVAAVLTNNTTSGAQNVAVLQNAAGSGTTEGLLVLDNADTDTAVTNGLQITSAAGGVTTALDVSDPDIVTALLFGANDITGTNFSVTGSNGTITSAGNATLQGGVVTVGTSSQAGTLVLSDGSSNTGTLQVTSLGSNQVYTLPDATGTICLDTGNCSGAGVTLQTAYNNSSNPEIVLDATRGALTLRDNATPLAANLFEVQNNGGGTTYFNVTSSGIAVTGTATVSSNINSSGGALQTNSTTRVDNSGNLTNIGNLTATGALTIASSGAGNDVTIDGADQFIIQDAAVFNSTAVFNSDVDLTFADTENLSITNTVTGTNAVDLISAILTNNTTSGTQQVAMLQNAAGSGTTESLLVLDNADTDTAVTSGLKITSAAGGITTAVDVSDPDIVTALLFGANDISGTNFSVTGSNGNFTSAGNGTIQGGTVTVGTSSQSGTLVLNDGSSNTGSLVVAALGQNTTYTLPDPGGASATICLTTGNCAGTGGGVTGSGTNNTLSKFTSTGSTIGNSTITDDGANVTTSVDLIVQGGDLTLGVASSQTGSIAFKHSGSANTGTITQGALTGNRTYTLPDIGGTFCLTSGNCSGAGTGNTLQAAYDAGNTITTTDARDIAFTLANTSTDSNFTVTTATGSTSFVSFTRADGAGTADPAQLLLVKNNDVDRAQPVGISLQSAAGGLTTAIDASGSNITNALAIGAHAITGTNFNVTGAGAVTAVGVNAGAGLLEGALGLTVTGAAVNLNASSNFATNINTGTSTGTVTIGGGSSNLVIDSTNFDVSSAGALSGITTIATSGAINGQTISSSANFTGTLAVTGNTTLTGDIAINGGDITASGALNITPSGTLTAGSTGQTFTMQGNASSTITATNGGSTTTLSFQAPTANAAYRFATAAAGTYDVCTTAGNCSGVGVTLQSAYNGGSTISTTDARDISFTLADTSTDGNFTISTAAGSGGFTTISLADGVNAAPPAQLLLINNNDTNQALGVGISIQSAAGGITTAFDASGSNITNALAIGAHAITGTNFSVTGAGAVTAVGVNAGAGLIQGTGGLTLTGTTSINNNTNSNTSINTGSSSGTITLGGGSAPLVIDSTNFDVSSAGALSGITGYAQASGNFLQSGSGTFGTGTGAVSLNGDTTVAATKTLTVTSGLTSLTGNTSGDALNVSNSTSTGNIAVFKDNSTAVATIADAGATTFQNSTDSTGGFKIQNSTSGTLFNVDTTSSNITLLGNNSGEPASWQSASNVLPGTGISRGSTVTLNGYVYMMGGQNNSGTSLSTVSYSKLNADGTVGTWQTANALPSAQYDGNAVTANGYIYYLGGNNGSDVTTVYYAKANPDGTVGTWQTATNPLPAGRSKAGAVVANGYVYLIGGSTGSAINTNIYAKLNTNGSVGTWTTSPNNLPGVRDWPSVVSANGYVYAIGGGDGSFTPTNTAYYSKLNSDGTLGTWNSTTTLPNARRIASAVVANGYVYIMGGFNSSSAISSTVYYGKMVNNGTISSWGTANNSLPAVRIHGHTIVANGYLYFLGGAQSTPTNAQTTVYYASLSRLQIGAANIDLVGLQGGTLADAADGSKGSSLGGTLTAGNTLLVGTLNLQGAATFDSSLAVNGTGVFNDAVSIATVLTLGGGQTADITTSGAATATALTLQPGISTGASSNGAATTVKGGDGSGTTTVTGGLLTLQGGSATGGSGTRNGGNVAIDAGTGATANGAINIGAVNDGAVTIGKSSGTATLTFGQSTASHTINIGNATIATGNTGTINIGTSATGTGKTAVTVGSTNDGSSVLIQGGNGNVQIQSQGGTLGVGNNAVAQTLQIGNTTGGTAVTIDSGTGNIAIATGAQARTVNIATGGAAQAVTLGSTNGGSALTLQAGTGGLSITTQGTGALNIGNNAVAQTLNIGNGTGGTAVSVLCGTGTCGFGNNATDHSTTLGSTTGTSAALLQSGSGGTNLTSGGNITIGTSDTTGTLLVLDDKTSFTSGAQVGDPTGVVGGMYYNSALGQFRCYEVDHWRNCMISARTEYHHIVDMGARQTNDGEYSSFVDATGDFSQPDGEAGHPGITQFNSTTGSADIVWAGSNGDNPIRLGNNDYWRYETVLRIPTSPGLSGATQRFIVRAGFVEQNRTTDGSDGCFFKYSDNINTGKWQGFCISGGTSSTCDTTTTVAAGTWYRLTVVVNAAGTQADFRINGVSKCTVTTNIPTGAGNVTGWGDSLQKTVGTTDRDLDVDYEEVEGQFGTAR